MAKKSLSVVDEMQLLIKANPELQQEIKQDPIKGVAKAVSEAKDNVEPIYKQDIWIYRGVVGVLGLVVLIAAVGYIVLAFTATTSDQRIPEALVALGSGALGALAGLLAPSPVTNPNSE